MQRTSALPLNTAAAFSSSASKNFPAFPQPENNAVSGGGGTKSDGRCMATEIDYPERVHALHDLVV